MLLLTSAMVCAALVGCTAGGQPSSTQQAAPSKAERPTSRKHKARADSVADLSAHVNDGSAELIPARLRQRQALLDERRRATERGDRAGLARLNSVLAAEAFDRAARLTTRWLDRRDAGTGLFPARLRPDRRDSRHWTYGDAGSDLFPFLALATRYLMPTRYPEILANLAAERAFSPGLPQDFSLDTRATVEQEPEKRMLGAVEYAKDGLLPLAEALGPDPWLGRLREVMDQVIAASAVPSPPGPLPADSTEVNGSALQALARLYWATGEQRYVEMGRRIAAAYVDHALPATEYLPPHRWDFTNQQPIGEPRFYLGDHGNEIVSGLVEWHRVEIAIDAPERARHRDAIRKMLDRLLVTGRTSEGLWYEVVEVPSGRVRDRDLSDNWGYLGQAYLNHAAIERTTADGDAGLAERLVEAVRTMLRGVSTIDYYAWENGDMDGYADTLEGALYLLRYLDVPETAVWLDEQIAVLYGYQQPDGSVTEENIDGNFIRTAMLYGFSMTQGVRPDPWTDHLSVGAARDGDCLRVHLHAELAWTGRLVFDVPRSRLNLGLPTDYPRLNQWPERFVVEPDRDYTIADGSGRQDVHAGADLAGGLPVSVTPGQSHDLLVCPR